MRLKIKTPEDEYYLGEKLPVVAPSKRVTVGLVCVSGIAIVLCVFLDAQGVTIAESKRDRMKSHRTLVLDDAVREARGESSVSAPITPNKVAGGGGGGGSAVVPKTGARSKSDPLLMVLSKIMKATYKGAESVMTGRFLRLHQAENQVELLMFAHFKDMRPVRRGKGWIVLEMPYMPEERKHSAHFPWEDLGLPELRLRLRMVECDGQWKLEHAKVVKRRAAS